MDLLTLPMMNSSTSTSVVAPSVAPAVVVEADALRTVLIHDGRRLSAQVAVPGYRPMVNDLVLSIVQGDDAFIIGVLSAKGPTVLSCSGDLRIEAGGSISLRAAKGLDLDANKIAVRAASVEVEAVTFAQRVRTAMHTIADLLHISAGRQQVKIAELSMHTSARSYQRSEAETVIHGSSVHVQ
jgi:Protein of unknown function (DUF3540)